MKGAVSMASAADIAESEDIKRRHWRKLES
jgi:hypothetical protein